MTWPEQGDDSEALLAVPRLAEALSKPAPKVLILRGEGGREFFAETLRSRGVQVDILELYRRQRPDYPPGTLLQVVRSQHLNGLVISSGQGSKHCARLPPKPGRSCVNYPCSYPARESRRWRVSSGPSGWWTAVAPAPRRCWQRCAKLLYPSPETRIEL